MAYLTEVHGYEETLEKFKDRIQDVMPRLKNDFFRHDLTLLKFLLARDFDVDRAEEMFRKDLEWRETFKVDQLLMKRFPKHIQEGSPIVYTGRDKKGYPVVWHPVARWEIRKSVKLGWTEDMREIIRQYCECMLESLRRVSEAEGKYVGQYIPIMDMEGFDYSQLMSIEVVRLLRIFVQEYFDHYPEMPCLIRVINAPRLFKLVWAVIEPILSPRSLSKFEIYGTNKEEWKGKLLEFIDPDSLPSALGGSNTTWKEYRVDNLDDVEVELRNLPEESFQEIFIPAGQKHKVKQEVKAGDKLIWNFKSDDYDVGFEAHFEDGEVVARYSRVDSHKFVQKGLVDCKSTGKYTLTFDNSFSKLTGKTLRLAVLVEH